MIGDLSNKIIDQIDTEQIMPTPRWHFVLMRIFFWTLAFLSIIIGSFAVGVMLFLFSDYYRHGLPVIPHDLAELLLLIPYVWLVVFGLFIMIGRESIKHTPKGYQYRLYIIVLASVFLSFMFGSIFYFAGIGKTTHEFFNNRIPFYNFATYDSRDAWSRPMIGRLAGVIIAIKDKNNFSVLDFSGHIWQVRLATSTGGSFVPEASSTVRISGLLEPPSNLFIANSIVEWEE
jgi:hypothetical protein